MSTECPPSLISWRTGCFFLWRGFRGSGFQLGFCIPVFGGFFARAGPWRAALEPVAPPFGKGDAAVIVIDAKLIAAGGADFKGSSAASGTGVFLELGVVADRAGERHGGEGGSYLLSVISYL
jgi:hypothetical protein